MEHFEPLIDPANPIIPVAPQVHNPSLHNSPTKSGNIRSMFKSKGSVGIGGSSVPSNMPPVEQKLFPISATSVDQADKINKLQKLWLHSVATCVKMQGNIIRTDFDIALLDALLTAESYYDSNKPECERKKIVTGLVATKTSDELIGFHETDLAEYFDPDIKFPGRDRCHSHQHAK